MPTADVSSSTLLFAELGPLHANCDIVNSNAAKWWVDVTFSADCGVEPILFILTTVDDSDQKIITSAIFMLYHSGMT